MMKRMMCIWLPDWPLQRITLTRPELRERPVVLHEPHRGTQRVAAASARAGALGVDAGMPLAEAAALANDKAACGLAGKRDQGSGVKDQSLVSIPHDPVADREALEALAGQCERFSPVVGIEQSTAPDSLLLDVTGLAHLFGGEAALTKKILRQFHCRGLIVRVAIADTIGAAWAVTRFCRSPSKPPPNEHSSFIIHHSSFHLVPPGGTSSALRPLPILALRLPAETVDWLHQLGIDRIGRLEALPREELGSRFGPELIRRWDQATGRLAEPIVAHRPPAEFRADWSPDHPAIRRETIEAAMEQLIAQVAEQLVRRGRAALRLVCRLDCLFDEPLEISVGLFEPTASAGHLYPLLQMQLERLRLPGPVSAMQVAAVDTAPLVFCQRELFSSSSGSPQRHVAGLIDRLSSRLGRRSVMCARLLSDAQPELAYRYHPLVGGRRRRSRHPALPAELPPRPLRLLTRPIALTTTSNRSDGPPLRFHVRRQEHRIAHAWGPERIETGWWRSRTAGRDYYHIETTTGRRFWLFRRLRDGRWFVHGTFE